MPELKPATWALEPLPFMKMPKLCTPL